MSKQHTPHRLQGASLVELMITIALGLIITATLTTLLTITYRERTKQHAEEILYADAYSAVTLISQDIKTIRNTHCFNYQYDTIYDAQQLSTTTSGIKIIPSNSPQLNSLLPSNVIKKLLKPSQVIVVEKISSPEARANFVTPKQMNSDEPLNTNKNTLLLLHNCQTAWLIKPANITHANHKTKVTLPYAISNATELPGPFSIAPWQQIIWFAMKDSHNKIGLYRLQKPDETAPVEISDNVVNIEAKTLSDSNIANWQWQNVETTQDWKEITAVRLKLTLEKNHQTLEWPVSVKVGI